MAARRRAVPWRPLGDRAAARLRISRRQAIIINNRRRQAARRGFPDLFQTHEVAIGGSFAAASFNATDPITFKFRVNRTSDTVSGDLIDWDQGEIGFATGELKVTVMGSTFTGVFMGAPIADAEVEVAWHPGSGETYARVDGVVIISGTAITPGAWITSGSLAYDSIVGATVLSPLEIYEDSLPGWFGMPAAILGMNLITEAGDNLVTELGEQLITE